MNIITPKKEFLKLKDIASIEVNTDYRKGNYWLVIGVKLRDGNSITLLGTQLSNLRGKTEPEPQAISLILPSESNWEKAESGKMKLNELTLNLGIFKAKWKKEKSKS